MASLFERIRELFDPGGEIRDTGRRDYLRNPERMEEYIDGVHIRSRSKFGADAPTRDDWKNYILDATEGYDAQRPA